MDKLTSDIQDINILIKNKQAQIQVLLDDIEEAKFRLMMKKKLRELEKVV